MKILLDTCTFLWIESSPSRVGKLAASAYFDQANECYLSVSSAWEIAIKHAAGRMPLPDRPDIFVPKFREVSGIESLEIDEDSALLAGRLPAVHSDPFDRMLVAQAIVHGMTILTPDPLIAQYAVRTLW